MTREQRELSDPIFHRSEILCQSWYRRFGGDKVLAWYCYADGSIWAVWHSGARRVA